MVVAGNLVNGPRAAKIERKQKELIHRWGPSHKQHQCAGSIVGAHVVRVTFCLLAFFMSSAGLSASISSPPNGDNEVTPTQLLLSSWIGAIVTSAIGKVIFYQISSWLTFGDFLYCFAHFFNLFF